jgi:hypothetical protein
MTRTINKNAIYNRGSGTAILQHFTTEALMPLFYNILQQRLWCRYFTTFYNRGSGAAILQQRLWRRYFTTFYNRGSGAVILQHFTTEALVPLFSSTFLQNELLCNVCLHKLISLTFSKLLWRSFSALPGRGLKDIFISFQMSPWAI